MKDQKWMMIGLSLFMSAALMIALGFFLFSSNPLLRNVLVGAGVLDGLLAVYFISKSSEIK